MDENLEAWGLEISWDAIKIKTKKQWKAEVHAAAETMNKQQILQDCYKKQRGGDVIKMKTKTLIPILEQTTYKRQPQPFMNKNNKLIARAYIMGRYGMLQCAANYSNGYGGKACRKCGVDDTESHRINYCTEWRSIILVDCDEKINFDSIYSENENDSMKIVHRILCMWDLGNNNNCMRSGDPN